ncbi:hypothetical protein [Sphingomonas sp. LaA6.9]|uniref:hypothetical protein n=1 Tax=Sphingomonas sp. LaA6.9 TaxID=2919914 RepID=UPI001F4F7744|nr:hypothetical protein [Sphingomonas sp. LaA6.9]MCJ8158489.1 hypothetical protein [Sphingomonas sp. LaA6.9]
MNTIRARLTGENRAIALWIVACALMLRMLVPAGWMPATDADGAVRITLCTGQGLVEAWVATDGSLHDKAPQKSEPKTDQPCSFAGLGAAFDAVPAVAFTPSLYFVTATAITLPASVAIGRGLAAPPPPAIGPPATL